ncbi:MULTISPECIES: hypothetical protein [Pontibacillus]|uniref:Uncharacterized protein n=1 Tax=Pontibacillus chungwhensis TaxID=265426 RepID=A0ABY8UVP0_9BACI|nr:MULTISPECIES: hypothetical protein [Pontibacillus]MCD5324200.1 hypothetical protein [Pontibacillus sp. HN14]WIF97742.1 hypothetical protein QNI29_18765 [Pontibacillus chungwhensis]
MNNSKHKKDYPKTNFENDSKFNVIFLHGVLLVGTICFVFSTIGDFFFPDLTGDGGGVYNAIFSYTVGLVIGMQRWYWVKKDRVEAR